MRRTTDTIDAAAALTQTIACAVQTNVKFFFILNLTNDFRKHEAVCDALQLRGKVAARAGTVSIFGGGKWARRIATYEERGQKPIEFGHCGPRFDTCAGIGHERRLEQRGDEPRCYDKLAVVRRLGLEDEHFSGHQNQARDVRYENDKAQRALRAVGVAHNFRVFDLQRKHDRNGEAEKDAPYIVTRVVIIEHGSITSRSARHL